MSALKIFLIALVQTLVGFLAPIYMLFVCSLGMIKWDQSPSYVTKNGADDKWDPSFLKRGYIRFGFLKWMETPDMPLPGGMYEPTIFNIYGKGGLINKLVTSYVWLGLRNRAHGLAYNWGHPTVGYIVNPFSIDESLEHWSENNGVFTYVRDNDWQIWKPIGVGYYMVYGFESHRMTDGTFRSYNHFTFKKRPV